MKKIKVHEWNRPRVDRILNGTSVRYTDLSFFSWANSPQGRDYWNEKYRVAHMKKPDNKIWDDILTPEDYAYFRVLVRKRFRKDTFLSSPAQREYVKFAEELPFE